MKRKAVLFYILISGAVLGSAQDVNLSRYREITLPQFEAWKQGLPREGTDPALFKARVLFEELSETVISFTDAGSQSSIYFTIDKTWPEMEEGQPVTIYFTASGSWSWNRVLDEIDRGPARPAQDPPADDLYSGGLAFDQGRYDQDQYDQYDQYDQDQYDQGQYDQDQYDQAGYGEEPDFDDFVGPDQVPVEAADGTALAEAEGGTETPGKAESGALPPSPVPPPRPAPSPPAGPAASRDSAVSVKITGTSPRPGKVYRLQVGAYTVERNAVRTLSRLQEAGFSPNYEQHGRYLRVVLSGVRAADVRGYAERIGRAGFSEIWCREEL